MVWNDDFHHTAAVAMTGRREAYYTDYLGAPQEFISAAKYGFLYQGQWYKWQKQRRGAPTFGVPPAAFVTFLDNHDQVANSGRGLRCHELTSPGRYRAMTALLLLGPGTPMLFQGQEFAASSPFLFFADHQPDLAKLVYKGRARFLAQFPSVAQPDVQAALADPADRRTFERCKLNPAEREKNRMVVDLHRDLLQLRSEEVAFRASRIGGVDGAVLDAEAFVLRFFGPAPGGPDDRLLVINLGRDIQQNPAPEPLLASPIGHRWETQWSSEYPRYGGGGTPDLDTAADNWHVPSQTAVVLRPTQIADQ
jgi:maltooligosyltrehalose trehalohydrolase